MDDCEQRRAEALAAVVRLQLEARAAERRHEELQQALADCDRRQSRPATNLRLIPEGRIVYENCYNATRAGADEVLTQDRSVGRVDAQGGLLECARLAAQDPLHDPNEPLHVAIRGGTECYRIPAAEFTGVRRHGIAQDRGACATAFDQRGANLGGAGEFALYTILPRGQTARFVRLVRFTGNDDIHIVALLAQRPYRRGGPLPVSAVLVGNLTLRNDDATTTTVLVTDGRAGGAVSVQQYLTELQRAGMDPAAMATTLHLGPQIGNFVMFDLGSDARVGGISLRNVSRQGEPALENRLRGCRVQLLDQNLQVVFSRDIDRGAAEYEWDVR